MPDSKIQNASQVSKKPYDSCGGNGRDYIFKWTIFRMQNNFY